MSGQLGQMPSRGLLHERSTIHIQSEPWGSFLNLSSRVIMPSYPTHPPMKYTGQHEVPAVATDAPRKEKIVLRPRCCPNMTRVKWCGVQTVVTY